MTALKVYGVLAPEKSVPFFAANAGGTAEGLPFVPKNWDEWHYFFAFKLSYQ